MNSKIKASKSLIAYIAMSVCFIVWPFSFGFFYSQIVGMFMFLMLFVLKIDFIFEIKTPRIDIFLYLWGVLILALTVFLSLNSGGEFYLVIFYCIKFILFYFITYIVLCILHSKIKTRFVPEIILFSAVSLYVIFIILQVAIPVFNTWSFNLLATEAAKQTIESNMSGHSFRNYGWNGFLFASDGIAFAFSALFLSTYRRSLHKKFLQYNYFIVFIELACIALAAISGRSAIPIILIYLMFLFCSKDMLIVFIKLSIVCFLFFSLSFLSSETFNNEFLNWFFEPIYSSITRGSLFSNSTAVTNDVYFEFFSRHSFEEILSKTNYFYYKNNSEYYFNSYVGADSGFIRIFYALGLYGLVFFLSIWVYFILRYTLLFVKFKKEIILSALIFTLYSLVFFYKSEWMYQNFFIFYFFVLYHSFYNYERIAGNYQNE